jgi:hypothetical protein
MQASDVFDDFGMVDVDHDVEWMGQRITALAAVRDRAAYEMLSFIRAFDECRGWERDGASSCAAWLEVRIGITARSAREHVRVAHAVVCFPAIERALERGAINYSKARAITRVATVDNEAELVEACDGRTAAQLEKLGSRIRREQALEGVTAEFDTARRWVSRSDTQHR